MASDPITSWQINGERVADFIGVGASPKSLVVMQMVIATMKLKDAHSVEENYDQPR